MMMAMMKVRLGGLEAWLEHGDHHWSPLLRVTEALGFVGRVVEVMLTSSDQYLQLVSLGADVGEVRLAD